MSQGARPVEHELIERLHVAEQRMRELLQHRSEVNTEEWHESMLSSLDELKAVRLAMHRWCPSDVWRHLYQLDSMFTTGESGTPLMMEPVWQKETSSNSHGKRAAGGRGGGVARGRA